VVRSWCAGVAARARCEGENLDSGSSSARAQRTLITFLSGVRSAASFMLSRSRIIRSVVACRSTAGSSCLSSCRSWFSVTISAAGRSEARATTPFAGLGRDRGAAVGSSGAVVDRAARRRRQRSIKRGDWRWRAVLRLACWLLRLLVIGTRAAEQLCRPRWW
jgi:hypothetical protein